MHRPLVLAVATLVNLGVVSVPFMLGGDLVQALDGSALWAFYVLITIFLLLESSASMRIESCRVEEPKAPVVPYLMGLSVLLVFWVSVFDYSQSDAHGTSGLLLATVVFLLGICLRAVSVKKLGKQFTSHIGLISKHKLTTTGIYSYVRHPSEAGLLLIAISAPIILNSAHGLCISLLLLLPTSLYRIYREDKVLYAEFKEEFATYKLATPSLWPAYSRLVGRGARTGEEERISKYSTLDGEITGLARGWPRT